MPDVAFESTLLDDSSSSLSPQWKVEIAKSAIKGSLDLKHEYMPPGKGSILFEAQRPSSGSVEVPDDPFSPY